jgi:hypothetical protein
VKADCEKLLINFNLVTDKYVQNKNPAVTDSGNKVTGVYSCLMIR